MNQPGRKLGFLSLPALALACGLTAPAAWAQGVTETLVDQYSGPDEFYFFGQERKLVADYKKDRIVRVCVGDSQHTVPLKISYDEKQATIAPGDCVRVEAKKVFLQPKEPLDSNRILEADVDTLS